ncbi:MAG: hypothetical protein CM1200mP27_12630 [Chloroflexota bacterium]|nr:MAG: hypothetical protein CM1200mP27_12630 [Chloroflexota bacterium]
MSDLDYQIWVPAHVYTLWEGLKIGSNRSWGVSMFVRYIGNDGQSQWKNGSPENRSTGYLQNQEKI